jgi:hypothetical protein
VEEVVFYPTLPDFWKSIAFEGSQASPVCPYKNSMQMKFRVEHLWNDIYRERVKCWEKETCPNDILNLTWTASRLNPGLCGERAMTKHPSLGRIRDQINLNCI